MIQTTSVTELQLIVTEESEIVKNPVPILWNLDGLYGWIPVEVVKNEVSIWKELDKTYWGKEVGRMKFTWQQTYRLRQDVGRMLEDLGK